MLTAYDHLWAGIFDDAGVDSILVGDSLAMVVQGRSSTLPVTLGQMIYHGELVSRAVRRALVVVDMPFMSYQVSARQAVRNAGRIIKQTGCDAVKLEGGAIQSETIRGIGRADIPVMAHIGMRPQAVRQFGGMGRIQRDEQQLFDDARAAEDAGAFAIVLELIPADIAARITQSLSIPTIGIGAGPGCSGQVLVGPDMLGTDWGWNTPYWWNLGVPWGGMFSTVGDMARFCQMFLNGGELDGVRILSPATVQAMTSDQTSANPAIPATVRAQQAWGLGWRQMPTSTWSYGGNLLSPGSYGHGGATGTVAWVDPARQVVCTLFTNEPAVQSEGLLGRVSNLVAAAVVG